MKEVTRIRIAWVYRQKHNGQNLQEKPLADSFNQFQALIGEGSLAPSKTNQFEVLKTISQGKQQEEKEEGGIVVLVWERAALPEMRRMDELHKRQQKIIF